MKTARTQLVRSKSPRTQATRGLTAALNAGSGSGPPDGIGPGTAAESGRTIPRSGGAPRPRSGPVGHPGASQFSKTGGGTSVRPPALRVEQRRNIRFDKAFPVAIRSEAFGEASAIARNVSAGGIMVELTEPLPLGTRVQVFFSMPDSHARIVARGEVKNHYFLNFADPKGGRHALTGMGVRFTGFESDADLLLGLGLTRLRTVLH